MRNAILLFFASMLAASSVSLAGTPVVKTNMAADALDVSCPPILHKGVLSGVEIQNCPGGPGVGLPRKEFTDAIPSGWDWKRELTYQNFSMKVLSHKITPENEMLCVYGSKIQSADSEVLREYNLATIKKPVPGNKACKAVDGFKFKCTLKAIQPK
jgi:hypothetical protein